MVHDVKSLISNGEGPGDLEKWEKWWRVQLDAVEHALAVPSAERVAWLRSRERELRTDRDAAEYRAIAVLLAPVPLSGRTGTVFDTWLEQRRADLASLLATRK